MVAFSKVQDVVEELFGHCLYDQEVEDRIAEFVYRCFPGKFIIAIMQRPDDTYYLDFEFEDPHEEVAFRLKYQ